MRQSPACIEPILPCQPQQQHPLDQDQRIPCTLKQLNVIRTNIITDRLGLEEPIPFGLRAVKPGSSHLELDARTLTI